MTRRFDPRTVLAGTALAVLAAFGGFTLVGVVADRTDRLAAPVLELCSGTSPTALELARVGACGAAIDARWVGPYRTTTAGEVTP